MPTRRGHDEKPQKTHIPRPPNAFILFRSSFIRNEHVPGKVEGNHSTLSKIIGLCWKDLSPQERRYWEDKAREAQAEHRKQYPDWRWTPEANVLGKKRARKARKQQDDVESSSQDDPDPSLSKSKSERKPKGKDKAKARERSHDHEEVDEDARVAKIADLLKQGKTGPQLQSALDEWKATLSPADTRPPKKRRTARKPALPSLPASTSRTTLDLSPTDSHRSSPPAQPPTSPLPTHSEPPLPLRRSPSDNTDVNRIPSQSGSLINRAPSHTPSPTVPLYPSPSTVPTSQNSIPPVSWSDNATTTSFSASQPPYPPWWPSSPSATSSSPLAPCYKPPEVTADGLGYEEGSNFDHEYSENFGSLLLARSHDDPDGTQWSRNTGRAGLCTVISDPLSGCDEDSPPTTAFPPPVDVASSPVLSSINSHTFRNSPTTSSFIPSTYSSLTGWAGEYDPTGSSMGTVALGDWFNPSWQGSIRHSSPWGQESDVPENARSSPPISYNKIPYHNQDLHPTSLHLELPSSSSSIAEVRQLDSSHSPSSIAP